MGEGLVEAEVQLNRKDNNKFNKLKSAYKIINLDRENNANFEVDRSKKPKRIRIVFYKLKNKSVITLSNITLKNNIIKTIDEKFGILPDAEISMEANPDAIDKEKMLILKNTCSIRGY